MENVTNDILNNRKIIQDFELESLTIIGDYSSSSVTTYWIVNRFNLQVPCGIYITKESAERSVDYINKMNKTNTFIIIKKTIFI